MRKEPEALLIGNRVRLSGGYDFEPEWLSEGDGVQGTVVEFIPGQNKTPAAVVRLDTPLSVENKKGDILVLELRYVGQTWEGSGTVHLELCDFVPSAMPWNDRRQGKWIESHATYQRLAS